MERRARLKARLRQDSSAELMSRCRLVCGRTHVSRPPPIGATPSASVAEDPTPPAPLRLAGLPWFQAGRRGALPPQEEGWGWLCPPPQPPGACGHSAPRKSPGSPVSAGTSRPRRSGPPADLGRAEGACDGAVYPLPQQPGGRRRSPGPAHCPLTPAGQGSQPGRGPRVPDAAQMLRTRHPSLLGPATLPQRSLRPGSPQHLWMPNTGVLLPSRLHCDGASGLGSTRRCPLPQDPPPGLQGLGSACAPHPWVSVPGHLRVTLRTHRPARPQGPPGLSSPGGDQGPPASSSLPWCPQGLQGVPQEHQPAEQPPLWSPASSSNPLSMAPPPL